MWIFLTMLMIYSTVKKQNKKNEGFPQHVPSSVDWTLHLTVTLHLSVLKAYGHILTGLT